MVLLGLYLDIPKGELYNTIDIYGSKVPFGINMLFQVDYAKIGVEICEDMWVRILRAPY